MLASSLMPPTCWPSSEQLREGQVYAAGRPAGAEGSSWGRKNRPDTSELFTEELA
jgi:hypothetical protein